MTACYKSWVMKKNKIASGLEDTEDCSWEWKVRIWEITAHNPSYVEGIALDVNSLEAIARDQSDLEGMVGL